MRSPIAPLHEAPSPSSQQISQRLAGHRVHVLDAGGGGKAAGWLSVRGDDGYAGWMHRGYLAIADDGSVIEQPGARTRMSLGCVTRDGSGNVRRLPLAALLAPDEVVACDPDVAPGRSIGSAATVLELTLRHRIFAVDAAGIARTSRERFAGAPYQWGGVTPWGADCSGLVQTVYWLHGINLPRDAWQQAAAGDEVGMDIGDLRPADLLFFSDREDAAITHVGIALGDHRMVHSALGRGGFRSENLAAASDPYVARLRERFRGARRLVGR